MPSAQSLQTIAQLNLVQFVDDKREPADPFKLPTWLRTQVDADLTALETADSATVVMESQRLGKSGESKAALEDLEGYLREGYRFIAAIRASKISDYERQEVFAAYGWSRGLIGRFNESRIIALARLGVADQEEIAAEFRYPEDLAADLRDALARHDLAEPESLTGGRQQATQTRNEKLEAAKQSRAQARHYYCCASRDLDQTKELSKIGYQPRRDPGEARRNRGVNGSGGANGGGDSSTASPLEEPAGLPEEGLEANVAG